MGDGTGHRRPPRRASAHRQLVTRGANLVLAGGVVAGTWTRKAGTLTVAWFGEADPPDHDLLGAEAARLAAVLGTELDLDVRAVERAPASSARVTFPKLPQPSALF